MKHEMQLPHDYARKDVTSATSDWITLWQLNHDQRAFESAVSLCTSRKISCSLYRRQQDGSPYITSFIHSFTSLVLNRKPPFFFFFWQIRINKSIIIIHKGAAYNLFPPPPPPFPLLKRWYNYSLLFLSGLSGSTNIRCTKVRPIIIPPPPPKAMVQLFSTPSLGTKRVNKLSMRPCGGKARGVKDGKKKKAGTGWRPKKMRARYPILHQMHAYGWKPGSKTLVQLHDRNSPIAAQFISYHLASLWSNPEQSLPNPEDRIAMSPTTRLRKWSLPTEQKVPWSALHLQQTRSQKLLKVAMSLILSETWNRLQPWTQPNSARQPRSWRRCWPRCSCGNGP